MSAFSRGCLLRHQCHFTPARIIHLFNPLKSYQQPRFLSSSTILRALKKSKPTPSLPRAFLENKTSFTPTKTTASSLLTNYQSYAATLAQKSHPTLLYQAPSHAAFILSSYSAAFFCFSYAGFSFYTNYLDAPADLAAWVPIAFGGICFMMAAFGGWLLLGPARLIRTITAVPKSAITRTTNGAGVVKGAVGQPELMIEVELRKMFPLPFFPARKVIVKPEEIILPVKLAPSKRGMSVEELRYIREQEELAAKQLLEYERSHILTSPFRHMSRAFFNMFKAIARTWSREGFLKLGVKGQTYKLDITGGWVLDRGKALDRLATIKPKL
jgi:hypothetical protein